MNVRVHIERLIVDGRLVDPAQSSTVQKAVEAELAQLFAADSKRDGLIGGAADNVRGADIHSGNGGDPINLGRLIARSAHGGIIR